jgi:hypothetical protein
MNAAGLPTEGEMQVLKRALNSLLWTKDVPEVPANMKGELPVTSGQFETAKVNIQCAAHMVVVSGLLARRGFQTVTRRGMAFVVESSPDGNPRNALLNQIAKHFWFTLRDHGLVDLSLHGENESPLVYCNRTPGNRWALDFGDDGRKVERFIRAKQQGCLYVTLGKKVVSQAEMEQSLGECFAPAKKAGIQLAYGKLVDFCERVLAGAEQPLDGTPQTEAWAKLAR